jgi:hypothetical protein
MRTETINIYKFNELPEKVQEKIIESWRDNDEPHFAGEIEDTLKVLEKLLHVTVKEWSYDDDNYSFKLSDRSGMNGDWSRPAHRLVDEILSSDLPCKIYRKGYAKTDKTRTSKIFRDSPDDCPWTGVVYDCAFADALKELRRPENYFAWDMETFANLVFDNLFSQAKAEYKHWLSAECIKEDIEANDYEFIEGGKIV